MNLFSEFIFNYCGVEHEFFGLVKIYSTVLYLTVKTIYIPIPMIYYISLKITNKHKLEFRQSILYKIIKTYVLE